jgi:hypothetical protein
MDASLLTACRYAMPFGLDVPNRLTEAVVTADAEELSLETFRHNGIIFEVIQQAPDFAAVTRGTWLQLCYDPYDSKDDKVGEVISCEGRLRDYRIVLALDGDPQQECVLDSTDGAFAIIKKVGADRVPVSPAEPFARPAPGPSALRPTQVISNGREPPAVRRTGKRPAELNNGGGDIMELRALQAIAEGTESLAVLEGEHPILGKQFKDFVTTVDNCCRKAYERFSTSLDDVLTLSPKASKEEKLKFCKSCATHQAVSGFAM